jgi:hypothetical protein
VPWTFAAGSTAEIASSLIALILAGVIAYARVGGSSTWLQTYGVLIRVGAMAAAAGHPS